MVHFEIHYPHAISDEIIIIKAQYFTKTRALASSTKHTSAENVHLKSAPAFALTNAEAALCIQDALHPLS